MRYLNSQVLPDLLLKLIKKMFIFAFEVEMARNERKFLTEKTGCLNIR